jgi:hypothetical protein
MRVFISILAACVSLQTGCVRRQNHSLGIPDNQRVVLKFERFDEDSGRIWMRLVNQTAWDIRVPVELGSSALDSVRFAKSHPDGAEAIVRYYLEPYDPQPFMQIVNTATGQKEPPDESTHPPVPQIRRGDVLVEWWIPKNQSIDFSLPKEHLARNIALSVDLRYEWERQGTETLTGPVHRVYFRGIDLPNEVQARIK